VIVSPRLLADLKGQLKLLETDLRAQSDDPEVRWARDLGAEHGAATERGRTALTWSVWRDGEVAQAAVAWLLASTFVRFCEDNRLLDGARTPEGGHAPVPWITGPVGAEEGDRFARAVEHQTAYFEAHPTANDRDWLRESFTVLASLPAGRGLVDPNHNPMWAADISAEAARGLLVFWRRVGEDGHVVHDFTDPQLDTRFLGDLYQDLSDLAKKKYALLQTPIFVEEFILDQTLEPAIREFGLPGLQVIDPTCGSGHFLLGAFARLNAHWQVHSPALDARERVQKALDSLTGVDLNPFAIAIARFRLTAAALRAAGEPSLVTAPAFAYHLAVGDSLLGEQGTQGTLLAGDKGTQGALLVGDQGQQNDFFLDDADTAFAYAAEDLGDYRGILTPGRYHAVFGNPPYITVKDPALSKAYRKAYETCHRKYALSVPFMELFFRLARREGPDGGAGYVGQITSNSFMKREFGKKLIENLFSGRDQYNPVDLTSVIDTSGAYIPGHGTPTVILVGRRRRPTGDTIRAALGVRGEPGQPQDPSKGFVWTEIVDHIADATYEGSYVTITDLDRKTLSTHPWSLSGGGAGDLKDLLDNAGRSSPSDLAFRIGVFGIMGSDDAFMATVDSAIRTNEPNAYRPLVVGDQVRDYAITSADPTFFPYSETNELQTLDTYPAVGRRIWSLRTELGNRATFTKQTYFAEGRPWYEWHQLPKDVGAHAWTITFAFVATHNHFALDRGGKVFNRSAPVIKLRASATEDDHLALVAILNTSIACFWLKQVCHNKGSTVDTKGARQTQAPWEDFYEFTGTKLQQYPLPALLPGARGRALDRLAQDFTAVSPGVLVAAVAARHVLEDDITTEPEGQRTDVLFAHAQQESEHTRARMIFEQEELDWEAYRLYGLLDTDLTYAGSQDTLSLDERAFEIALARKIAAGEEESAWFERHGSTPITDLPAAWPADYRDLVQRRLEVIEAEPFINLLERPENKRRWATVPWDVKLAEALRSAILDRLEDPALWRDAQGAVTRSVAQLADLLRGDRTLRTLLELLQGSSDVDVEPVLTSLVADESVPYLAACRYKASGLVKFREWQHVWDLQRAEDRIDAGAPGTKPVPVPPKYAPVDFERMSYWRARGKLDVPKERFISYPGTARTGDASPVLGWAGWDHAQQAIALARLLTDQEALGADAAAAEPLLAGLVELEPWLHQWHAQIDPAFGASPASSISGLLEQKLAEYGRTRDDVTRWTPTAAARGRRKRASSGAAQTQAQDNAHTTEEG
jgi:hypothetical protein